MRILSISVVMLPLLLMVMLLTVPSQAFSLFDGFFSRNTTWDLCSKCKCPTILQEAREHGVTCRDVNLTSLVDGVVIERNYSKVDFSKNSIASITEDTFKPSFTLRSLDLSANVIESLGARVFKPLSFLNYLSLQNNLLQSLDAETFDGIGNLTYLDLSYNKLSDLPPGVFDRLPKLEYLSLAFNPLASMSGNILWGSENLLTLDLSGVGFKTLHKDFFSSNMTKLEKLVLAFNSIEVVPSKALFNLRNSLTYLDLSANPIKSLGAYTFFCLSYVKTLILAQMLYLESIEAYSFGDLTSLQKCEITYAPRIINLDGKAFHTNKNGSDSVLLVEDFTFSFSVLHTLPEGLLKWEHLRQVRLEYNQWQCDCNMKWIKNSTLVGRIGERMICSSPDNLRGRRLSKVNAEDLTCGLSPVTSHKSFGFLVGLMVLGFVTSMATVALLVYWRQGWLCRRPQNAYTRVRAGRTAITVTDDMEWDNKDLETESKA
ncbi:leucine-rich repeat-containing protein 15-like isoform X2 [Penaeus japonicus]|uniref:leucine-rich repeat-containing protein 15-like isoform X2 n=1 Tax=Penaeus japonicus TaxID=27405 RepID=UPI001C70EBE4|nr:leucine-rich repeat-containing protein 15-like isoform X2 [Penaeus japonicus]